MKIKIIEAGYEGFTGQLGVYEFEDGVTVDDIGRGDAAALGAMLSVVDAETGMNPSETQRMITMANVPVPVETSGIVAQIATTSTDLTRADLEDIADTSGIKGIREIAEVLSLKGNAISELIDKILAAQDTRIAAAAEAAKFATEAAAKLAAEAEKPGGETAKAE